jgi:hypothetical protein
VGTIASAVKYLKGWSKAMGLGIIIPIATFWLLLRYLIDTQVAKRPKYVAGAITGASLIAPPGFLPQYTPMLAQLAVSIFILFYLKGIGPDK